MAISYSLASLASIPAASAAPQQRRRHLPQTQRSERDVRQSLHVARPNNPACSSAVSAKVILNARHTAAQIYQFCARQRHAGELPVATQIGGYFVSSSR